VIDVDQAASGAPTTNAGLASAFRHTASRSRTQTDTSPNELVCLSVLDQPRRCGVGQTHDPDAFVCVEHIRADAQRGLDVVLEQPMDHDHVATNQFLTTGHPLLGDQAVMDDELQVKPWDVGTRVAVAL